MNAWLRGMLALALVSGLGLGAACGGAETDMGPQPVTVSEWCDATGESVCRNTGNKCFAGMAGFEDGCRNSFTQGCTSGKDAGGLSGRTSDDLAACINYVEGRSCEQLGADTGQSMMGGGTFVQLCKL